MMKLIWIFFILAINAHAKVVKIGLASNFSELSTFSYNPYGQYFRNGVSLALAENITALQNKNIQIETKEYDYGASDLNVIKAFKQANADGVSAVIGYNYSSNALIAAPLHMKNKIPMLSPSASANRLKSYPEYVHLGSFSNEYMAKVLAAFTRNDLKARSVLVIPAANCAYCVDLGEAYKNEFRKLGGQVTDTFDILQEDKSFKNIIEKAKQINYDAVFIPNQELTAARIILTFLEAGIKKPFLGADGWGNEGSEFFSVLKGKSFEGYSVTHWHPELDTKESRTFVKSYQDKFGRVPNDTSVLAYDFTNFLIHAILKSKQHDRISLEKSLKGIRSFKGISGNYIMRSGQAPAKDILILKTSGNRFVINRRIPVLKGDTR